MKKTIYNPTTLEPNVGHFARAVRFGDWLLVSGITALTNVPGPRHARKMVEGIEAQTRVALDNVERALTFSGGTLADIYEVRVMLKDGDNFDLVDKILTEQIPPGGYIAHAYQVRMINADAEIEIEVKAYLGELESVETIGRPGLPADQ